VRRARRFKALFGGGVRQAGIVAAGALHALRYHRERLAEDHANARRLAEGLTDVRGVVIDAATVATNIVRFRLERLSSADFVQQCFAAGVYLLPSGGDGVRAVLHRDISAADVDVALSRIASVLKRAA
jgi:threonine aldolase